MDYNLESNVRGLFVLGEANFSDHGANRLGASALMQGLADGYFVIPYTIGNYLAQVKPESITADHGAFAEARENVNAMTKKLLGINGRKTPREFHRELGTIMWEHVGMARSDASLKRALELIPVLRDEFWQNVRVVGTDADLNQELERAGRVADFLDFAELLATDALHRKESCGGHFRVEYQLPGGEARRDDDNYSYVGAWGYQGVGKVPTLYKEPLVFENIHLGIRSYK
ncbi:MAG: frdA [Firmicutes bacterium]|nr:frdA [Bacillota bacterium]